MPKLITTSDGKQIIDTGLPQKHIKPIWLEMHRDMNLKIMDAIVNKENLTSGVTKRMIQFSISMVLDEDVRKLIVEKRDKLIKERITSDLSNVDKARIEEEIYFELMADVTDYVDKAFGVSHRIAVGID